MLYYFRMVCSCFYLLIFFFSLRYRKISVKHWRLFIFRPQEGDLLERPWLNRWGFNILNHELDTTLNKHFQNDIAHLTET